MSLSLALRLQLCSIVSCVRWPGVLATAASPSASCSSGPAWSSARPRSQQSARRTTSWVIRASRTGLAASDVPRPIA